MRLLFSFLILLFSTSLWADNKLDLENAWIRQAPPMAKNLAGYGLLKNISPETIRVVAISSASFEKVEMHITSFDNGMMKMQEVKVLELRSGESEEFEPGGRHFMMIKPKKPIKAGMKIPLKVTLESGEIYQFEMQVRK